MREAVGKQIPSVVVAAYRIRAGPTTSHASVPTVDVITVYPLYGPVAGGTRVTVTGKTLTTPSVTAVFFGHYKSVLITHRCPSLCCSCRPHI